jgi:hypothetical protein
MKKRTLVAHQIMKLAEIIRQTATKRKGTKIYMGVEKRIATFFEDKENEVNVRSVSIFGY